MDCGSANVRCELLQIHMIDLGCCVIIVFPEHRPRTQVKWPTIAVVK